MEQRRQREAGQSLSQHHHLVHDAAGNGGEAAAAGVAEGEIPQGGTPELRGTRGYSDVSYSSAEDGGGPWSTSPTEEVAEEEAMEVEITGEDNEYGDAAATDVSRSNTDALETTHHCTTEGQEGREGEEAREGRQSEVTAAAEGSGGGSGGADVVPAPGASCSEEVRITPSADDVLSAEDFSQSVANGGETVIGEGSDAVGHEEMEPIVEKSKDV